MNILIPTSSYPLPGQASWGPFVKQITLGLADQGHRVFVLIFSPDGKSCEYTEPESPNVRVITYPFPGARGLHASCGLIPSLRMSFCHWLSLPFYFLAAAVQILKISRSYRIDLIHAMWYVPMGFLCALLKPFHKRPVVITGLGADLHLKKYPGYASILQLTAKIADINIVCSEYLLARTRFYGLTPEKFRIIPNGISPELFSPKPHIVPQKIIRVGWAKRLIPEKNVQVLLEALKMLPVPQNYELEVHIAGDGPQETDIRRWIKEKGLSSRVIMRGSLPHTQMPAFFREMDIVVDTSTQEGISNANLEALASGCFLIAPDGFGNRDIRRFSEHVILYKPLDAQDLVLRLKAAVQNLISNPSPSVARPCLPDEFAITTVARQISDAYAQLC